MKRKSNKKQLVKIIVTCVSDNKNYDAMTREFDIPKNGSHKVEAYGGDLLIFDADKNIMNRINWQAGFTQEYEFFYEES